MWRLIEFIIEGEDKLVGIEGEIEANIDEIKQGCAEAVTVTVLATPEAVTVVVWVTFLVFVFVEVFTIVTVFVRPVATSAVGHTGQASRLWLECAASAIVIADMANIDNFAKENDDMTKSCFQELCLEYSWDVCAEKKRARCDRGQLYRRPTK